MDFKLDKAHQLQQQLFRNFAETEIKPLAKDMDEAEAYDMELQEEREILAIVVPTELRGPIMEAVNAQHGLRSKAQSIVCSLPIDEIVRL